MASLNISYILVIVYLIRVTLQSCTWNTYGDCGDWDTCTRSCGGGEHCHTCYSCALALGKRFCERCNEHCYNGVTYSGGGCLCPNWRTGSCCEICRHINIPHCVAGQQQCGGSPDGIMCTQCEPGYHSGGNNQGCLDTDECAAGTSGCAQQCTNTPGSYVCSCLSGYWLWTDKHTCNYDNCTFESDSTCAWTDVTSGDGFDWTLTYGAKGKYMYIGTSGTRQTGDRAWLISPLLLPVPHTERCLQFGYNMNAPSIGLLSVYMATHGERPGFLLWRMSGDQGQEWKGASVELNSLDQYQVIIEAVVGNSYFGDIAIDDLSILPTTCQLEKGLLIG